MKRVIVRVTSKINERILALLFDEHPKTEWATFFDISWYASDENLLICIKSIVDPRVGEVYGSAGHVEIDESYALRMALFSEASSFGVGLVHSHPTNCPPLPSLIDNDMDMVCFVLFRYNIYIRHV